MTNDRRYAAGGLPIAVRVFAIATVALTLAAVDAGARLPAALRRYNRAVDRAVERTAAAYRPLIGITATNGSRTSLPNTYWRAVANAGGIPIIIPVSDDAAMLAQLIGRLDGVLLSGGADVAPEFFGEPPHEALGEVDSLRDRCELAVLHIAGKTGIPVFGICRGVQMINVAYGGTLWQDLPAQYSDSLSHRQRESGSVGTHTIVIESGSRLSDALQCDSCSVNTFHHQAVKGIAGGFVATARTADGVIEAIEASDGRPVWGVQFHPEIMADSGDESMASLFSIFISDARRYAASAGRCASAE